MTDQDSAIRGLLECPVCMESFHETTNPPIAVHCQHTLCATCIERIRVGTRYKCPSCSDTSQLKSDDITKLPKDITRLNLMELLKKQGKQVQPARRRCTSCDEGEEAVTWCGACQEDLCLVCTAAHRRTRTTKGHELVGARDSDNSRQSANTSSSYMSVTTELCERHENNVLRKFCIRCEVLICDKCASESHAEHQMELCDNIYSAKSGEINEILGKLKLIDTESLDMNIETTTRKVCDQKNTAIKGINQQFRLYTDILTDRCRELTNMAERWCREQTQALNTAKARVDEVRDVIGSTESAIRDLDRIAFLKGFGSLRRTLQDVVSRDVALPDAPPLTYSQVCPTEDFSRIVQALGTVQEGVADSNDGEEVHVSAASGDRSDDPCFDTTCVPLMEVLKSLSLHSGSSSAAIISNGGFGLQCSSQSLPEPASIVDKTHMKCVSVRVPDKGRKKLYDSPCVKQLTGSRFQTWDLTGCWEVRGDEVVMYSTTAEKAEQCIRLLSESLVEKRISVQADTMALLESDKWQVLIRELEKKYPQQVGTSVDHDRREVVCHACSAAALEDVSDRVRMFLRDNQVRNLILSYDADTVRKIMRCKKSMDTVQKSYSQYCIQILKDSDTRIRVKGIGVGFGEAVRRINELARKCEACEDRFGSDDDDDDDNLNSDDDTRFDEDDLDNVVGEKKDVQVQMTLGDTCVQALCLPGDGRLIYVVRESITKLGAEAIVNPANQKLRHDGGLSKILVKEGGSTIQDECKLRVSRHGELKVGDVFSSSAGTLAARCILHVVGPKWNDGNNGELKELRTAVYNSLQSAVQQRLSSLAIPAIGTGSYGMPVQSATQIIVRTVADFLKEKPSCSIREVYLCDVAGSTVEQFAKAVRECFEKEDVILSCVSNDIQPPLTDSRGARFTTAMLMM